MFEPGVGLVREGLRCGASIFGDSLATLGRGERSRARGDLDADGPRGAGEEAGGCFFSCAGGFEGVDFASKTEKGDTKSKIDF